MTNTYNLANFAEKTERLKQLKEKDSAAFLTECREFLNHFPFCFGYFQQTLDMLQEDVDSALDLIEHLLPRAGLCRQFWEVYIQFASRYPDKEVFSSDDVLAVRSLALERVGGEWMATEMWLKQLESLREVDFERYIDTVEALVDRGAVLKDFERIQHLIESLPIPEARLQQLLQKCISIQRRVGEVRESETLLEKRSFFHVAPLKPAQADAVSKLTEFYRGDVAQLARLYYICAQTPELRSRIVRELLICLDGIEKQASADKGDVADNGTGELLKEFLQQHLVSFEGETGFECRIVRLQLCPSDEMLGAFILEALESKSHKTIFNAMRFVQLRFSREKMNELFKPPLLEALAMTTQSDARLLAELSFTVDELLLLISQRFQLQNCDALVVKALQQAAGDAELDAITATLKGSVFEEIARRFVVERGGMAQWLRHAALDL